MSYGEESNDEQGKQDFKYNAKELDKMHGLNQYDYLARHMDPATIRFTTVDPLAEKYYSWSPYAYVMNNPMIAVDPDGRLVIFINGFHTGDGGRSKYWGEFDKKVMEHLKDQNALYFDGALGGALSLLRSKDSKNRFGVGYYEGQRQASKIFNSIKRTNETIKIISHSMGGAYAKGFVRALLEHCEENKIDPSVIQFEADFAPFQPDKQKAEDGVTTYQFSHSDDDIAGNKKMTGAIYMNTSSDTDQGHSIKSFMNQISKLPAGNYKVVNGQFIKQ